MKSFPLIILILLSLSNLIWSQENRTITVGPVIGATTNTTARILVEFAFSGNITCILNSTSGETFNQTMEFTAGDPIIFKFENLTAGTFYNVTFDPSIDQVPSYFKTVNRTNPGELKFGLISCNEYSVLLTKEPQADLWADLSRRIDELNLDYLIHNGDQVYLDMGFSEQDIFETDVNSSKPYRVIMDILEETPREQWEERSTELLEIIKDEYRRVWGLASVREVLAKIPNLMMLDDHEVRDDWGFRDEDHDNSSADYFYGTLARRAYYMYQRQLRQDINFDNYSNIEREYFYRIINGVGFFFFDYRGIRTWFRNETNIEGSQIGAQQREFITNLFSENGTFSNLTTVFMISTIPIALFGDDIAEFGEKFFNDLQELWISQNPDGLVWLLDLMRNWKQAKEGRDIMVLAGDIHMGGKTNFSYNDEYIFRQFTASSMASLRVPGAAFEVFSQLQEIDRELPSEYEYKHYGWTNKFNYGLIVVENSNGTSTIDAVLVAADEDEEPQVLLRDDDPIWRDIADFGEEVANTGEDIINRGEEAIEDIGNIFNGDG